MNDALWTIITRLSLLILVYILICIVRELLVSQRAIAKTSQQILQTLKEIQMANQELADAEAQEDALLTQVEQDVKANQAEIAELEQQKADLEAKVQNAGSEGVSFAEEAELVRVKAEIARLQNLHASLTGTGTQPDTLPSGGITPSPVNAQAIAPNPQAGAISTTPEEDAGAGPGDAESNVAANPGTVGSDATNDNSSV